MAQGVSLSVIVASNIFWSVGAFVGEMPTGLFADRFGQKISLTCGYLLEALAIVALVFFPSTWMLILYFSLSGLAYSFLSGSEEALLYESMKRVKGESYQKAYGTFLSNEMIGFMIATAFAGFAYAWAGTAAFNGLLLLTAGSFFTAAFLSRFLVGVPSSRIARAEGSEMFLLLKDAFRLIRRNKTVWALTLVTLLTISGEYLMQAVYQPYFSSHGVPSVWLGLALTFGTLVNIIANRLVYRLETRFTLERILVILNAPLGIGFLLLSVVVHPVFLVGAYVVMGGLFNLQMPVISDYVNARTHTRMRTTVLSGISFIKRLSGVILAGVLTVIVHYFGTERALMAQGIYLLVGLIVSYVILVRCGCTHRILKSTYRIE